MDYQTPKVPDVHQLKRSLTPITVDSQSFHLNRLNLRASTPSMEGLRSPGLSPIKKSPFSPYDHRHALGKSSNIMDKMLTPMAPKSPQNNLTTTQKQSGESPALSSTISSSGESPALSSILSSPSCTINVSLTSPPDCVGDISRSLLNSINISFGLNKTLNVKMLLQMVGLEMYAELFENEGIDYNKFMCIQKDDLLRLGLISEEHCKVLMDLQQEFNP